MPSSADARACRVPCFSARLIFSQFAQTWSTSLTRSVAEHVGVTAQQLVRDVPGDTLEVKGTALLGQLAVEHHLEEQIAQLLFHLMVVPGFNGINQLVDLLDRMPAQGAMVLLAIPGAAVGGAQACHDPQ